VNVLQIWEHELSAAGRGLSAGLIHMDDAAAGFAEESSPPAGTSARRATTLGKRFRKVVATHLLSQPGQHPKDYDAAPGLVGQKRRTVCFGVAEKMETQSGGQPLRLPPDMQSATDAEGGDRQEQCESDSSCSSGATLDEGTSPRHKRLTTMLDEPDYLRDDLRVAVEVQQSLIRLGELLGQPPGWEPARINRRPFVACFRRAVRKVGAMASPMLRRDLLQRVVCEWCDSEERRQPTQHRSRHEIVEGVHKVGFFWCQVRDAARRGVKELQAQGPAQFEANALEHHADRRDAVRGTALGQLHRVGKDTDSAVSPIPVESTSLPLYGGFRSNAWTSKLDKAVDDIGSDLLRKHILERIAPLRARQKSGQASQFAALGQIFTKLEHADQRTIRRRKTPADRPQATESHTFTLDDQAVRQRGRRAAMTAKTESEVGPRRATVLAPALGSSDRKRLPALSPWAGDRVSTPCTGAARTAIGICGTAAGCAGSTATDRNVGTPRSASVLGVSGDCDWSRKAVRKPALRCGEVDAFHGAKLAVRSAQRGIVPTEATLPHPQPVDADGICTSLGNTRFDALGIATREAAMYLQASTDNRAVPTMHAFFAESGACTADMSKHHLTDVALKALIAPLAARYHNGALEGLNLSAGSLKDGFSELLQELAPTRQALDPANPSRLAVARTRSCARRLDFLDLSFNPLTQQSIYEIANSLLYRRLQVRRLLLSGIPMTPEAIERLCHCVGMSGSIEEVGLSDTHIGRSRQESCDCAAQLCFKVGVLDLSHNFFREEGLASLGRALGGGSIVTRLSLAGNVWSTGAMQDFCEAIGDNCSLDWLDLSACELDDKAAICLEDSLTVHPHLQQLDMSQNPIGVIGLRAMLRITADDSMQLNVLRVQHIRQSIVDPIVQYNPAHDSEDYLHDKALSLGQAYHRAVLRLLLRRAESVGNPVESAFNRFTLAGERRSLAAFARPAHGRRFVVPAEGVAAFSFVIRVIDESITCASDAVAASMRKLRIPVGIAKFIALVRIWREHEYDEERRLFLLAATRDLLFQVAQIKFFAHEAAKQAPDKMGEALATFCTTAERFDRAIVILTLRSAAAKSVSPGLSSRVGVARAARLVSRLARLNLDSLTGRHKFDLVNPTDYSAADRCFQAMHWEASVAATKQLLDTTECGRYIGIRNYTIDGAGGHYWPGKGLPGDGFVGHGVVEFDYVTPFAKPSRGTSPLIEWPKFNELLDFLQAAGGTDICEESRFQALWATAHRIFLEAQQLTRLLGAMRRRWTVDLYVIMFPRCVDFGAPLLDSSHGLLCDRAIFSETELFSLMQRLGMCNTFDPTSIHLPGRNTYNWDLSKRDERIIVWYFLKIGAIEQGEYHFEDCHWTGLSEHCDTGYWRIPDHWFKALPSHGVVSFTYTCLDGHVNMKRRRELARDDLGWVILSSPRKEDPEKRKCRTLPR